MCGVSFLLVLVFHSSVGIRQVYLCAAVLAGSTLVFHPAANVHHQFAATLWATQRGHRRGLMWRLGQAL
jgi:hypothetical protein